MNDIILFATLIVLGIACFGILYASIKWFEKI